jgi:hypothetical protein
VSQKEICFIAHRLFSHSPNVILKMIHFKALVSCFLPIHDRKGSGESGTLLPFYVNVNSSTPYTSFVCNKIYVSSMWICVTGGGAREEKQIVIPLLIVHILKMPLIMAKNECKKKHFCGSRIFIKFSSITFISLFTFCTPPVPFLLFFIVVYASEGKGKKSCKKAT